jgi:hypothetical protein
MIDEAMVEGVREIVTSVMHQSAPCTVVPAPGVMFLHLDDGDNVSAAVEAEALLAASSAAEELRCSPAGGCAVVPGASYVDALATGSLFHAVDWTDGFNERAGKLFHRMVRMVGRVVLQHHSARGVTASTGAAQPDERESSLEDACARAALRAEDLCSAIFSRIDKLRKGAVAKEVKRRALVDLFAALKASRRRRDLACLTRSCAGRRAAESLLHASGRAGRQCEIHHDRASHGQTVTECPGRCALGHRRRFGAHKLVHLRVER